MPRDMSRVTYDENGGMVTKIPEGTPKEEIAKAKARGDVDKNDPAYNVEDAREDAKEQTEAEKKKNPDKYANKRMGATA